MVLAMANPCYQSIENIRFLAFVNYKIEESIFGHFYFTLSQTIGSFCIDKNVFSIKQDRFASKKNVLTNKQLIYDSKKMFLFIYNKFLFSSQFLKIPY